MYGNPSSPRALHKTIDAFFKSEGFDTIGFEESVWRRPAGGKYSDDIYVSTHDEGEVTEYLGCETIRDREARTAKIVQSGYAECVLSALADTRATSSVAASAVL